MGAKKGNTNGFKKGQIPWIKGKTKKEYPQLSNSGCKKGHIARKNIMYRLS